MRAISHIRKGELRAQPLHPSHHPGVGGWEVGWVEGWGERCFMNEETSSEEVVTSVWSGTFGENLRRKGARWKKWERKEKTGGKEG